MASVIVSGQAPNVEHDLCLSLCPPGCPAAPFPSLSSHLGTDGASGGGTTGTGAEVANAKTKGGREGGVGVNEGGRHNCCYPRWIHTTNEGGPDFTQREGVKARREKETQGWKKG